MEILGQVQGKKLIIVLQIGGLHVQDVGIGQVSVTEEHSYLQIIQLWISDMTSAKHTSARAPNKNKNVATHSLLPTS